MLKHVPWLWKLESRSWNWKSLETGTIVGHIIEVQRGEVIAEAHTIINSMAKLMLE